MFLFGVVLLFYFFPGASMWETEPPGSVLEVRMKRLRYDPRIRPGQYERTPLNIAVHVHLESLSPINLESNTLSAMLRLKQTWRDPRLAYKIENTTVIMEDISAAWTPDTYIQNVEGVVDYKSRESFLRVHPAGTVAFIQLLSFSFRCPISLEYYPFDSHLCAINISSFAHNTDDIRYHWITSEEPVRLMRDPPGYLRSTETSEAVTGEHVSVVTMTLSIQRESSALVFSLFFPLFVLVCLSWLAFYIDQRAVGSRYLAGFAVLMIAQNLISAATSRLPEIPCVTCIGVFAGICMLFIIASIVETTVVCLLSRKKHEKESATTNGKETKIYFHASSHRRKKNIDLPMHIDHISRICFPVLYMQCVFIYTVRVYCLIS